MQCAAMYKQSKPKSKAKDPVNSGKFPRNFLTESEMAELIPLSSDMGMALTKKFAYNFTLYYYFPFLTEHKHCNIPITSQEDSRFMKSLDSKTATDSDKILVVHFKNISPELYQMLEKIV